MTDELAASINDWRSPDPNVTPDGGKSQYYEMLPNPVSACRCAE